MKRRQFLLSLASCLAAGLPAVAASVSDDIVAQLVKQGFTDIKVETTWLGRIRILAQRNGGIREIVVNPRTGEILRDLWTAADGTSRSASIVDDVDDTRGTGSEGSAPDADSSDNGSGSGSQDDGASDAGSGGDSQDSGGSDSGGTDDAGSGSGTSDGSGDGSTGGTSGGSDDGSTGGSSGGSDDGSTDDTSGGSDDGGTDSRTGGSLRDRDDEADREHIEIRQKD